MTLLDFELIFRPAKVEKARSMFQKGYVLDLRKAKIMWIAKMKIGAYKVQVDLSDIVINRSTCNCDARPRSGYCEHSVAVLFALRQELGLPPALNSILPKIPQTDDRLVTLLDALSDPDLRITQKQSAEFTATAKKMTREMEALISRKEYVAAAGLGFAIVNGCQTMSLFLNYDYAEGDNCTDEAFTLLEKWCAAPVPEDVLDNFAHDVYREALRNFTRGTNAQKTWLDVSLAAATSAGRQKKFATTLDILYRIAESTQQNYLVDIMRNKVLRYKEQLSQRAL